MYCVALMYPETAQTGRTFGGQHLTPDADLAFDEARSDKWDRGLYDDVVRITIDRQWWLMASGESFRAANESEWILRCVAEGATFDRGMLQLWMAEIRDRRVSDVVAERVFREVRGLSRVPNPRP